MNRTARVVVGKVACPSCGDEAEVVYRSIESSDYYYSDCEVCWAFKQVEKDDVQYFPGFDEEG